MCDSFVAMPPETEDGAIWFGKNSDREPGEAQLVESIPRQTHIASEVDCTYLSIPQVSQTHAIAISRPFWMWGAEMGVNEHGLVVANEAVFTRVPVAKKGLTGMDLVRLALERAVCAEEAVEVLTSLLSRFQQGGCCGYRNKRIAYHNSFLLADAKEGWILDTAGPHWAAKRVSRGFVPCSNMLNIGTDFERVSDGAYKYACEKGWSNSAIDFDFAKSFSKPLYLVWTAGKLRQACVRGRLSRFSKKVGFDACVAALSDHGGLEPHEGWRPEAPCVHASWWPTRQAAQTTASMVCRIAPEGTMAWFTGTSSPCLSVFKPVVLNEALSLGPEPKGEFDKESLFWRHEYLHRLALLGGSIEEPSFSKERQAFQQRAGWQGPSPRSIVECNALWEEHRALLLDWTQEVETSPWEPKGGPLHRWYWKRQGRLDRLPPRVS